MCLPACVRVVCAALVLDFFFFPHPYDDSYLQTSENRQQKSERDVDVEAEASLLERSRGTD